MLKLTLFLLILIIVSGCIYQGGPPKNIYKGKFLELPLKEDDIYLIPFEIEGDYTSCEYKFLNITRNMSITATLVNKITIGEEYFVLVEWDKDIVNVTKDFLEASSWMDYYNLKSCWNMCGNMEANSKFSDNKLIVSAKFNSRKESNFSISIIIGGPCSKDSKQVESWIKEGYSIIASNSDVGECISSCMPKRFSQQFFLSKNSTKYINHTSICQGLEGRYLIFLEANCEYKENNITFSGHYHESLYANK